MKELLIVTAILLAGIGNAATSAIQLPASVSQTILADGRTCYVLSNAGIWPNRDYTSEIEGFKRHTPNADDVAFDITNRQVTITGAMTPDDLKTGVDILANAGIGIFPYWDELIMAERRSAEFSSDLYTLVYTNDIAIDGRPAGLLHSKVDTQGVLKLTICSDPTGSGAYTTDYMLTYRDGEFSIDGPSDQRWVALNVTEKIRFYGTNSISIRVDDKRCNKASLNARTCYCNCHSRYALRVFDESGKHVWEDLTHVFGFVTPLSADLDGDGTDEIVIFQHAHEKIQLLVFQRQEKNGRVSNKPNGR